MEEYKKNDRRRMQAMRLTKGDPKQKVDSSTWTPPEALEANVQTGARPLVKRLYKKGGKVVGKHEGKDSHKHGGRMPRKSGGRTDKLTPDSLINRDIRTANEVREGKKHVGAFKKGGAAKKFGGGPIGDNPVGEQNRMLGKAAGMMKKGGRAKHATKGTVSNPMTQDRTPTTIPAGKMVDAKDIDQAYYDMAPKTEAQRVGSARRDAERAAQQVSDTLDLASTMRDSNERKRIIKNVDRASRSASAAGQDYERAKQQAGYKKGGKTKHPDVKEDKALIKKMVKPSAMKADEKCWGGRTKKYSGGGVFSGDSKSKVPGATGGRKAKFGGGALTARAMPPQGGGSFGSALPGFKPGMPIKSGPGGGNGVPLPPSLGGGYGPAPPQLGNGLGNSVDLGSTPVMRGNYGTNPGYGPMPPQFGGRNPPALGQLPVGGGTGMPPVVQDYAAPMGGQPAYKRGGRTKGKTQVNIVIASGHHGMPSDNAPNMPVQAPRPPMGVPVPPPATAGGAPMGGGMPPMMPPPGMMPRKSGGRTNYPIETGSGGGEARLDKIKAYGLTPPKRGK